MATEGEVQAILEALGNPARKHELQGMYDQNPGAYIDAERIHIRSPQYLQSTRWGRSRGLLPWEREPEKYRKLINRARYGGDGTPAVKDMPIQEVESIRMNTIKCYQSLNFLLINHILFLV